MENNTNLTIPKETLLSVCVGTYNHYKFISQCLDGLLMQKTNFSFEIILGEDESTDGTREICIEYANKYPDKIRLFLRSRREVIHINGRPTGRFNFIENLKSSTAKYIALCDGDDYWTDPFKLQKQVDFLENNPQFSLCFTKANLLKDGDFKLHHVPDIAKDGVYSFGDILSHYNFIATSSVVFINKLIYPDWFAKAVFGDMGIYLLLDKIGKYKCLNDITCVYRISDSGIYSRLKEKDKCLNLLKFYNIIYPETNAEQQAIIRLKKAELIKKIASLKFPRNILFRKIYALFHSY